MEVRPADRWELLVGGRWSPTGEWLEVRSPEDLAWTVCREAGKPIAAARGEVKRATATFAIAAREAATLTGEMVSLPEDGEDAGKLAFTVRKPVGVIGAITPFNFPLNLVAHKVAPAIAAGCAVVLKPVTRRPRSGR
jgi:acyl-CoA reductase-like NAD-dependent aldehyde dehydrogenase